MAAKIVTDNSRASELEINAVWSSLIEAEISLLYWGRLIRSKIAADKWAKIIILISSASAVASSRLVLHHPDLWEAFSIITVIIAFVQLILDFPTDVNEMAQIHEKVNDLQCEYDELLRSLPSTPRGVALEKFNTLKRREREISARSVKLTLNEKLRDTCYTKALNARGVVSPIDRKGKIKNG